MKVDFAKSSWFLWLGLPPESGTKIRNQILSAEAIRTTVVPISILIRTTVVPIRIFIRTTGMWLIKFFDFMCFIVIHVENYLL